MRNSYGYAPRKTLKKFFVTVFCVALLLSMFSGCSTNISKTQEPSNDQISMCMLKYSSYVGAYASKENEIGLLVYIPKQTKQIGVNTDDFSNVSMALSNDYLYTVLPNTTNTELQLKGVSLYMRGEKGSLYKLLFTISNLEPGIICFHEIEMKHIESGKKAKHSIGNWCFDVRESQDNQHIEVTAGTGLSGGSLDFFGVSLVNNSSLEVVVLGADIVLDSVEIKPEITVFETFDNMMYNIFQITDNNSLMIYPKQNKTFKFDYSKSCVVNDLVHLKPFIEYEVAGSRFVYLPLNPSEYLLLPTEDSLYSLAINTLWQ